ncbi:MAG: methyl-accepting chemotaxis protein [Hydrogenovibrio sp.]
MFFNSLRTKVMGISVAVMLLVTTALGSFLYLYQIKPLETQVKQDFIQSKAAYINGKYDLKIQSGIIGATMLSLQPEVFAALGSNDTESLKALLSNLKKRYAEKTNFRGIFSELIAADGRSLMRSWKLDGSHPDRSQTTLFKTVKADRKAMGVIGFGERGVAITAMTPVLNGEDFLGAATMVQGVGSVSRDFENEFGGVWVMLVDAEYVQQKFGSREPVAKLKPVTDRYVFAHNTWFSEQAQTLTKALYTPVNGDQSRLYLKDGKVVVDLPAKDEDGQVFARQIFIQEAAVFEAPLQAARDQAWMTLISVVVGISLLTVILLFIINLSVIRPLLSLNRTVNSIRESGDFSVKSGIQTHDEVGQTAEAINELLDKMSHAVQEATGAVEALSKGELDQRIRGDFNGDLRRLKQSINSSMDTVETVMTQVGVTVAHLAKGELDVSIQTQAEGVYGRILMDTQQAMRVLSDVVSDTNRVMQLVSQGEFAESIQVEAKGQFQNLTDRINVTVSALNHTISDIARVMQAQAQGDLTQRVAVSCHGQLNDLKAAINDTAQHVAQAMGQVSMTAYSVAAAADEVSRGALSLSDSVQQQAASMEESTATMQGINQAIQDNAKNTVAVDEHEKQLAAHAEKAGTVMHQSIEAMRALQDSSHKIGEIVTLIDGIAFQTNLLALNAAVEAARAGDHGRGFAVVAGEVRGLAQKSADAAKDISGLIDESVSRIEQGTQLAQETEAVFQQINVSIQEVTKMMGSIASTSAQQAQGVAEVNQAFNQIDDITQQNAALVEQTSASASQLKEQAEQMLDSIRFFKTGHGSHPASAKTLPKPAEDTGLKD